MFRTSLITLLATLSCAQTAAPPPASPQPPADVDRALRARIKAFYDRLVDHQFRKAEEFVAPDYRDFYYNRDKPGYTGYELTSITYSADFTRADVVVTVRMPSANPMMPGSVSLPAPSIWRRLDGVWYWSLRMIDPLELLRGMTVANPAPPGAGAVAAPAPLPGGLSLPPSLPGSAGLPAGLGRPEAMAMAMTAGGAPGFKIDPAEVTLKPSATQTVTISNPTSAPMTLFLAGGIAGIEAAFDHSRIGPGEKAVLSIHAAAGATGGVLLVGVTETKAMITLPVAVK